MAIRLFAPFYFVIEPRNEILLISIDMSSMHKQWTGENCFSRLSMKRTFFMYIVCIGIVAFIVKLKIIYMKTYLPTPTKHWLKFKWRINAFVDHIWKQIDARILIFFSFLRCVFCDCQRTLVRCLSCTLNNKQTLPRHIV